MIKIMREHCLMELQYRWRMNLVIIYGYKLYSVIVIVAQVRNLIT